VSAWIDLENMKRTIRGIPPLAPASIRDMPLRHARRGAPRPITIRDQNVTIVTPESPEMPKESLYEPDRHRTTTPP
jgi:hypothetical protein